jgi:hypothetical protein
VDPGKVRDVLNWEPPIIVSEIQSFLGLAGYYRMLIEGLSKIATTYITTGERKEVHMVRGMSEQL